MRLLFPLLQALFSKTFGCFQLQHGGPFSSSPSQGTLIPSLSLLLFVARYFSFTMAWELQTLYYLSPL